MGSFDLKDRVALITGSGQGIGLGVARVLHGCGARIVINDVDPVRAQGAAQELGDRTSVLPGDVTEPGAPDALVRHAVDAFGRLDILVNNAGIGGQRKRTLDQRMDDWSRVIDVDLRAPVELAIAAARVMRDRGSGAIVNISSVAAMSVTAGDNDYGVAKVGLIHLTKSMALDLATTGVRVNAIAPGLIQTPLAQSFIDHSEAFARRLKRGIPMGTLGDPTDIGNAVAFLVSDDAGYITGVTIPVDGGASAGSARPGNPKGPD